MLPGTTPSGPWPTPAKRRFALAGEILRRLPTSGRPPKQALLTREECVRRAETALQTKTLSGVVVDVISRYASPRSEMSDLAGLIGRNTVLTARVLQAANSAAYRSARTVRPSSSPQH